METLTDKQIVSAMWAIEDILDKPYDLQVLDFDLLLPLVSLHRNLSIEATKRINK